MYVDNTILEATAQCARQALVKYVWHKRAKTPKAEPLVSGTYVHECVANYINPEIPIRTVYSPEDPTPHYTPENIEFCVGVWRQRVASARLPFEWIPNSVELFLEAPLVDDIRFCALIDAYVKVPGGEAICETKTTRSINEWWIKKWPMASQLTGQMWLSNKNQRPVIGAWVNGIELSKPPANPSYRCRTHSQGRAGSPDNVHITYAECRGTPEHNHTGFYGPYTRNEHMLEHWLSTSIRLAKQVRQMRQSHTEGLSPAAQLAMTTSEGQHNGHCRFCEFSSWCSRGAPADAIDDLFVDDVWDPKARALHRQG